MLSLTESAFVAPGASYAVVLWDRSGFRAQMALTMTMAAVGASPPVDLAVATRWPSRGIL